MAGKSVDQDKLDRIVAAARRAQDERAAAYREQALKMYPWVCGRCGREFTRENLQELTVHHRDHNHDHNPEDGSNWELLCLYCHDNEHARTLAVPETDPSGKTDESTATFKPFAGLQELLKDKKV